MSMPELSLLCALLSLVILSILLIHTKCSSLNNKKMLFFSPYFLTLTSTNEPCVMDKIFFILVSNFPCGRSIVTQGFIVLYICRPLFFISFLIFSHVKFLCPYNSCCQSLNTSSSHNALCNAE